MAMTWHATPYPGVRFREHPTRMHDGGRDRYYSIRCKTGGKDVERGLGWATAGMSLEKARQERAAFLLSLREGSDTAKALPARRRKPTLSFSRFWEQEYFPFITKTKVASSVAAEAGMYANWLKPALGALPLERLTADRLEALVADVLEAKRSFRTARYLVSVVSQVWNLAVEQHIALPENPCAQVSIATPEATMVRLLRPDEIRKILGILAQRDTELHDVVFGAVLRA